MHATPAYDLRPNRSSYSEPKCCESCKDPLLDLTLRAWILLKGVNMGVFERTDIVAGGRQASAVINVRPFHSKPLSLTSLFRNEPVLYQSIFYNPP